MNAKQIEARRTQMETYANKEGYFLTSYDRQKKRKASDAYVDDRVRVQ